jgi:hypothetical protein
LIRELDRFECGAVEPLVQLAFHEQASPTARHLSMRYRAPTSQFMDGSDGSAQDIRNLHRHEIATAMFVSSCHGDQDARCSATDAEAEAVAAVPLHRRGRRAKGHGERGDSRRPTLVRLVTSIGSQRDQKFAEPVAPRSLSR